MSAALLSPEGELSVIMVNLSDDALSIMLDLPSYTGKKINVYQVTKDIVTQPGFKLNALYSSDSSERIEIELPGRSISNATSYLLSDSDKGIIVN